MLGEFSQRFTSDVVRLELSRNHLGPCAVEIALRAWTEFVHDPYRGLGDFDSKGCGLSWCCADPSEARELLGFVALALPRKSARELRERLGQLDALY